METSPVHYGLIGGVKPCSRLLRSQVGYCAIWKRVEWTPSAGLPISKRCFGANALRMGRVVGLTSTTLSRERNGKHEGVDFGWHAWR
jgi:hypothetical protein